MQHLSWLCGLGKALNLSKPLVEWGTGTAPPGGCGQDEAGSAECSEASRVGAAGSVQSGSYGACSPEWPSKQGPRPIGGSSLWRLAMSAMTGPHPTAQNPTASASAQQESQSAWRPPSPRREVWGCGGGRASWVPRSSRSEVQGPLRSHGITPLTGSFRGPLGVMPPGPQLEIV